MRNYVLRKTVGPFSAGTRVLVSEPHQDGTVTVEIPMSDAQIKENKTISFEDCVFDCEPELLTKLRKRSEIVGKKESDDSYSR